MSTKMETRESFRWWTRISSRWADCDSYGHVNNAMYYNWFDTALTTMLLERGVLDARKGSSIGLCVSSSCEFLAPVHFPQTVEIGLRIGRIGSKSLRYELAIFALNQLTPLANGAFVHVFVDRETRTSTELESWQIEAIAELAVTR